MPGRLITHAAAAFALLVASACAAGSDAPETSIGPSVDPIMTLTGADGVISRITDVTRIVSLSGDLTEIVFALGHGDLVVGVDVTTVYPDEAVALPIVGVGRFITAEGVLSQNPTLVIGDTQSAPLAAIDQIREAGVPVLILPIATSFDDLYDKISVLGTVVGDADAAMSLAESIEGDVADAVSDVVVGDSPLRIAYIYTRGPDVVLMFGAGMVSNPVITAAGAIDAGADAGVSGSIAATAEGVVAAAPDVIVVPEEGYSILGGLDAFLTIPGIAQTAAAKNGRIYAYPEGDFLTFGPRVADSIRLLIADIQSGP